MVCSFFDSCSNRARISLDSVLNFARVCVSSFSETEYGLLPTPPLSLSIVSSWKQLPVASLLSKGIFCAILRLI